MDELLYLLEQIRRESAPSGTDYGNGTVMALVQRAINRAEILRAALAANPEPAEGGTT